MTDPRVIDALRWTAEHPRSRPAGAAAVFTAATGAFDTTGATGSGPEPSGTGGRRRSALGGRPVDGRVVLELAAVVVVVAMLAVGVAVGFGIPAPTPTAPEGGTPVVTSSR